MKKVFCLGSVTTDILVKPVDSVPAPGTLRSVDSINTCVGGCATNCAIDLGKLGIPVTVSCRIGDDFYGEFIKSELTKSNVDISAVVTKESPSTTLSIACIQSTGERSFLYNPASSAAFCIDDINWDTVDSSNIIFYTGAMLLTSFDGNPCAEFLAECQKLGKYTVMDTAWDFDDIWLPKIEAALPFVDLFMPSYDEAVKLSGQTEPEKIAEFFLDKGVKNVIIKLGADGAYIKSKDINGKVFPTYKSIKPVDTTGAGDSFCAGFLAGLSQGWNFEESAKLANAVGTHCIMAVGASTGIVSLEKTLEFMKNTPLE